MERVCLLADADSLTLCSSRARPSPVPQTGEIDALELASEMMARAVPEADAIILSTMPMGDGAPLLRCVRSASTSLSKMLSEVAQWTAANTEESNGTSVAFALGSGGLCVVDSRDFGSKGVRAFADWAAATENTPLKRHFAVTSLLNVRLLRPPCSRAPHEAHVMRIMRAAMIPDSSAFLALPQPRPSCRA